MNSIVKYIVFLFPLLAWSQTPWSTVYPKNVTRVPFIVSGGVICSGALIESTTVVTAAHCVDRQRPIFVYFKADQKISASVTRLHQASDLAIIQLETSPQLEPLTIMPAMEKNREGSPIMTIGHPVGPGNFRVQSVLRSKYSHVMSAGLISKVNNDGFISDMSVSPGNSGGPVFNAKGEIVGIVSKKRIDRFVGQLNYVTSHEALHQVLSQTKISASLFDSSSSMEVYLLYASTKFRENSKGRPKTYLNIGAAVDFWDRLRFFVDTNLDDKEVFTQYGMGWNFYVQGSDPLHSYRIIPTIESLKFQWKDSNRNEFEKMTFGVGLTLKASWFPIFFKASRFEVNSKAYTAFGVGLGF